MMGTPYIMVYRVAKDKVQIIAVLHGACNWKVGPGRKV